jgi:hypothetical protein
LALNLGLQYTSYVCRHHLGCSFGGHVKTFVVAYNIKAKEANGHEAACAQAGATCTCSLLPRFVMDAMGSGSAVFDLFLLPS